ncbi:MAG: hypothetical protein Q9216_005475 [Gyalolechia sp. 2 TL-2023]
MTFPYTYISCPCNDVSVPVNKAIEYDADIEDQERTFDTTSSRTSYSLYPIDHLMYCEDCQQIRCPRCTIEEIVCWYCPSCLFEIPSSQIKSEGNRCQRNCFNCPVCLAPTTVNALEVSDGHRPAGPFVLACAYCNWTSREIGIQLDKLTHMSAQLSMVFNRNLRGTSSKLSLVPEPAVDLSKPENPDIVFANLKSFLKTQLSESHPDNPLLTPSGDINYSSPSSFARIMSLYTNLGPGYGRNSNQKPSVMRESISLEEGLRVTSPTSDKDAINKLCTEGYPSTTTPMQRAEQIHTPCNFTSDLRPVPMLLRTKRASRCRTCRHILVKPEAKLENTRYRIRLIALNYVPTISIKPLQPPPSQSHKIDLNSIQPLQTSAFILSLRNPLFDPVNVTLATPNRTPGQWGHKVTILCPQFDIGANADAWDEALDADKPTQPKEVRSSKRFGDPRPEYMGQEGRMAEAGKVWEKGRNWTSVVVEVGVVDVHADDDGEEWGEEDEDVIEIPVFVRVEWEAEAEEKEKGKEGGKEKRELAYWVVLGVGRVGKLSEKLAS